MARDRQYWYVKDPETARERLAELRNLQGFIEGCADDWHPLHQPPDYRYAGDEEREQTRRHWIEKTRQDVRTMCGFDYTAYGDVLSRLLLIIGEF